MLSVSLLGDVEDLQALALSIIHEIGVTIQAHIDAAKARKDAESGEMVQQALFS